MWIWSLVFPFLGLELLTNPLCGLSFKVRITKAQCQWKWSWIWDQILGLPKCYSQILIQHWGNSILWIWIVFLFEMYWRKGVDGFIVFCFFSLSQFNNSWKYLMDCFVLCLLPVPSVMLYRCREPCDCGCRWWRFPCACWSAWRHWQKHTHPNRTVLVRMPLQRTWPDTILHWGITSIWLHGRGRFWGFMLGG